MQYPGCQPIPHAIVVRNPGVTIIMQHRLANIVENATGTSTCVGGALSHLACRISLSAMVVCVTIKHLPFISEHVRNAISQLLVASCPQLQGLMS